MDCTPPSGSELTLGVLAGGRATRLGGGDKAWLAYRGQALVERTLAALATQHAFSARLASANREPQRYPGLGLRVVGDRIEGFPGPLAGIEAILAACTTPLLLTVPVDLRTIPPDLVARCWRRGKAARSRGMRPGCSRWS